MNLSSTPHLVGSRATISTHTVGRIFRDKMSLDQNGKGRLHVNQCRVTGTWCEGRLRENGVTVF